MFAIQKKILRGINFVKITKNIFQPTRLPEERMGVTKQKKSVATTNSRTNYKKKPGGELICKNFGVNGIHVMSSKRTVIFQQVIRSQITDFGLCENIVGHFWLGRVLLWETDFYTPPVLGGAALLPFSAPAVYKNQDP